MLANVEAQDLKRVKNAACLDKEMNGNQIHEAMLAFIDIRPFAP